MNQRFKESLLAQAVAYAIAWFPFWTQPFAPHTFKAGAEPYLIMLAIVPIVLTLVLLTVTSYYANKYKILGSSCV